MEIKEEQIQAKEKQLNKKSKTRIIIVSIVALLTSLVAYIVFRGSYLEMMEIGENYISVFWQNITYITTTLLINFVLIYMMVYITNTKIKKGLKEFFDQEKKEMPKLLNKSIAFITAIIVSALTSGLILEKAMLFFNSASFGTQDPIFGLDIGYFVFQKPFIELVAWYFMIAMIALLLYTVVYYITTFNMFFDGVDRKTLKNSKLIKQVTTFVLVIAILLAILVIINTQEIGTEKFLILQDEETTYSLYGAGFTDVTIKLWGYRILALVIIVSVYKGIKAFKQENRKKLMLCIGAVSIYLVGMFFVMVTVKSLFVSTNELDKEKQYIEANIKYTKNAYGVDIEEINLDNTFKTIDKTDLEKYEKVLNNINVLNKDIVLRDLNNGQTAKGYYSYRNTQVGKYLIDGKEELVYLSPREIISSNRNL